MKKASHVVIRNKKALSATREFFPKIKFYKSKLNDGSPAYRLRAATQRLAEEATMYYIGYVHGGENCNTIF